MSNTKEKHKNLQRSLKSFMKRKLISILVTILISVSGLIALTGCVDRVNHGFPAGDYYACDENGNSLPMEMEWWTISGNTATNKIMVILFGERSTKYDIVRKGDKIFFEHKILWQVTNSFEAEYNDSTGIMKLTPVFILDDDDDDFEGRVYYFKLDK